MANTLGSYNPIFYAPEALIHLRNALGMAARVHRGYDDARRSFNRGSTVQIRKPATFTALPAPSTAQDLDTETVTITLNGWWEVKYELTDQELAWSDERIIEEHIQPAAYAIANKVDQDLAALYADIPWVYDYGTATDHTIITGARSVAFNNGVPLSPPGRMHMMVDGTVEMGFLNSALFHASDTVGTSGPTPTLLNGTLGQRFGIEAFANQNTPSHTTGTGTANDTAGALSADVAKGATSFPMNALGVGDINKGDTFVIAGNSQRYAVTSDVTIAANAATVTATPAAVQDYPSGAVVTFTDTGTGANALLFHRNAFALVFAPLPMNLPGVEVFTASDPVTQLSIRARRWTDADNSKQVFALDALWGQSTLDPNLGVRAYT